LLTSEQLSGEFHGRAERRRRFIGPDNCKFCLRSNRYG
jgi:hypothetical protein